MPDPYRLSLGGGWFVEDDPSMRAEHSWRRRFRQRFADLKRREGLTHAKLGERIGVTQGTIGHWLSGRRSPQTLDQFLRLEKALGLAEGELMHESPPPSNERFAVGLMDVDAVEQILLGMEQAQQAGVLPTDRRQRALVFCQAYHRWVMEGEPFALRRKDRSGTAR